MKRYVELICENLKLCFCQRVFSIVWWKLSWLLCLLFLVQFHVKVVYLDVDWSWKEETKLTSWTYLWQSAYQWLEFSSVNFITRITFIRLIILSCNMISRCRILSWKFIFIVQGVFINGQKCQSNRCERACAYFLVCQSDLNMVDSFINICRHIGWQEEVKRWLIV